jgi:hypothetical protein
MKPVEVELGEAIRDAHNHFKVEIRAVSNGWIIDDNFGSDSIANDFASAIKIAWNHACRYYGVDPEKGEISERKPE